MAQWSKRSLLKGIIGGGVVTVGLPFLDCFLDGNGVALASGAPMPSRFATWLWGCGVNNARWTPDRVGSDFDFKDELRPVEAFKEKITVFSGFNCVLNGRPNLPHTSGIMGTLTGSAPRAGGGATALPTIDTLVSGAIGGSSRFRSIEVACTGQPNVSYSMAAGSTINPSEVDPVALYTRIFGPEFADPNAATFRPDPTVMTRQSVLSAVAEQRNELMQSVGAADRARLDQYFTSVRQMEQQLGHMLEPPPPAAACVVPRAPSPIALGPTWEAAERAHDKLTDLLVMAMACNQTRVVNVVLSNLGSNLRRADEAVSLHELTHEEPVDATLGYQPKATFFLEKSMETLATFFAKLDAVREGDRTLLDNSLVLATTESNFAKLHSIDSLPMIVGGSAGGKWRSGQHITGRGDPTSRVGLTMQQVLGVSVDAWGEDAMRTSNPISDVIV
jgi:hypothetical protein